MHMSMRLHGGSTFCSSGLALCHTLPQLLMRIWPFLAVLNNLLCKCTDVNPYLTSGSDMLLARLLWAELGGLITAAVTLEMLCGSVWILFYNSGHGGRFCATTVCLSAVEMAGLQSAAGGSSGPRQLLCLPFPLP